MKTLNPYIYICFFHIRGMKHKKIYLGLSIVVIIMTSAFSPAYADDIPVTDNVHKSTCDDARTWLENLKNELLAVGWKGFEFGRASGDSFFRFMYTVDKEQYAVGDPGRYRTGEVSFDKCDNPALDPGFAWVYNLQTNTWDRLSNGITTTVTGDWSTLAAGVIIATLVIGVLYLVIVSGGGGGGGNPTCSVTSIIYSGGKLTLC